MSDPKCPMCGKGTVDKYRPFCSKRCADLDLGKWLSGEYRIPTDEEADPDDLLEVVRSNDPDEV